MHYVSKLKNDHLNLISILTIYSAFLSKTKKKKKTLGLCFIFKSNQMSHDWCVTSCLLCAKFGLLLRPGSYPPETEVLRVCSGGLWTAGAGTEQIRIAQDLVEVNTYIKVKPISWWMSASQQCCVVLGGGLNCACASLSENL